MPLAGYPETGKMFLEWDVFVRYALVGIVVRRRRLGASGRASCALIASAAFAPAATAQQRELVHQDFGAVFLRAGFLVVPASRLDLAFHKNLRALLYVIAHDLRGPLEGDQVVPLRLVAPVALRVLR